VSPGRGILTLGQAHLALGGGRENTIICIGKRKEKSSISEEERDEKTTKASFLSWKKNAKSLI